MGSHRTTVKEKELHVSEDAPDSDGAASDKAELDCFAAESQGPPSEMDQMDTYGRPGGLNHGRRIALARTPAERDYLPNGSG
jgi:hypothetical protein